MTFTHTHTHTERMWFGFEVDRCPLSGRTICRVYDLQQNKWMEGRSRTPGHLDRRTLIDFTVCYVFVSLLSSIPLSTVTVIRLHVILSPSPSFKNTVSKHIGLTFRSTISLILKGFWKLFKKHFLIIFYTQIPSVLFKTVQQRELLKKLISYLLTKWIIYITKVDQSTFQRLRNTIK